MKLIKLKPNTMVKPTKRPLVIGFFDGLHHGHARLFADLKTNQFDILTFVNIPSKATSFIYPNNLRIADLAELLPNQLFILDLKYFNMSAVEFANWIKRYLQPTTIYIGKNFKFGADSKSSECFVKNGIKIKNVDVDQKYSSTKAKILLRQGNILLLNKLLLAPYSIVGKVITGKRQGHKLGYPTANVMLSQECIPPMDGSYYGYTYVNNVKYRSAIFVRGRLIETHIFNFNKNIYGDVITIEFKKFDKKPSKSTSFDHLKMMLDKKIKLIKASF